MDVWKGNGELQLSEREENPTDHGSYGVFAYAPEDIAPLTLVFEVQKPGGVGDARHRHLSRRGIQRERSSARHPDRGRFVRRVLEAGRGRITIRKFAIENLGWAPAENARLQFGFVKDKTNVAPAAFTLVKQPGNDRGERTRVVRGGV